MIITPSHSNPNHDDNNNDNNNSDNNNDNNNKNDNNDNNKNDNNNDNSNNQMHTLPGGDSLAGWVGRGSRPRTKKVVCKWGRESLCQERENSHVRFRYDLHS